MPCRSIAIVLVGWLIWGCSEPSRGIGPSSDAEYTRELHTQLKAAGIKFTIGSDGGIWYDRKDEEKVKSISGSIWERINSGTESRFATEDLRLHFISMLESSNKKYHVITKNNEIWVRWYPDSPAEAQEMRERLAAYAIKSRQQESKPCGPASGTPAADTPPNLSLNKDAGKAAGAC